MLRRASFAFALVLLLALNGTSPLHGRPSRPRVTLWAWERPERLTFVHSPGVGVAYLAATVNLEDRPVLRPRLQPLLVKPDTPLTAVIRLELTPKTPTTLTAAYAAEVTQEILRSATLPRVTAIQIDFDALKSQRGFYRNVLTDLRQQLPSGTQLSITALGSWCLGDDWISGLPIDDAVPMLFRMGVDHDNIVDALKAGKDFGEPLCRSSVGVSTDEPWPQTLLDRNVYVFTPHPWSPTTFNAVERKLAP
jgi:Protein of unknown function (DUF3142)